MKKLLLTIIILGIAVICLGETTKPNKWDGFRNLKWGVNINDINDPNIILLEDNNNKDNNNDTKIYQRITDKLSIGKAKLKTITYNFYKDRLCGVQIITEESQNFRYLKDAVFAYYGEGRRKNEFIEEWHWGTVLGNCNKDIFANLDYNDFSEKGGFVILYMPIWRERQADEEKAAKEAESDF